MLARFVFWITSGRWALISRDQFPISCHAWSSTESECPYELTEARGGEFGGDYTVEHCKRRGMYGDNNLAAPGQELKTGRKYFLGLQDGERS